MKCMVTRDLLMDYISGDLSPSEAERIREHLAGCEQCRVELGAVRREADALSLLGVEEPAPDLVGSVRARLDRQKRRGRFVFRPAFAMAAAVLVCIVIVVGVMLRQPGERRAVIVHQPNKMQMPVVAPKPAPKEMTVQAPQPVEEKPAPRIAVEPRHVDRAERRAAPKPKYQVRKPSPAPVTKVREPQQDEPSIHLAVSPRAPEEYEVPVEPQEQEEPLRVTVVRHFDAGGNVRSVTITDNTGQSNDDTEPAVLENTLLPDAGLTGERESARRSSGGNITNA